MKNVVWVMVLALWVHAASAMKMESIYEAEVPVSSQDEQQRNQAIEQAFIQTLNKISGTADLLQNAAIKAAMPSSQKLVEEFSYLPSGLQATPFFLKVKFDPKSMRKLLRQAKEPIWDKNRPLVLVWLLVELPDHPPEIVDNQSNNEYGLLLKKQALQRGIPLLLPMMDLNELNEVSITDLRSRSLTVLQKASARYNSDGLLIGSIERQDKKLIGHFRLSVGQEQGDWELSGDTAPLLIEALSNKLATTLASRYASVQTEEISSSFLLVVKGISEQEDFENLLRFMKHISLIRQMEVENVLGDEVSFRLEVQGAQQAFMQEASVGQHLKLQMEKENELTYLWMR